MSETTGIARAPQADSVARSASNCDLVGLLLLRHSSLLKIGDDHPHKQAIKQARDNAQSEVLWRLSQLEPSK